MSITYGVQVNSLSAAISFEIGNVTLGNSSGSYRTVGGVSMPIFGSIISQYDGSPFDRAGLASAEASQWVSDTSLLSTISRGVGGGNRLIITTGVVPTTEFEGFAYSLPELFQNNVTSNNNRTFKVFGGVLKSMGYVHIKESFHFLIQVARFLLL